MIRPPLAQRSVCIVNIERCHHGSAQLTVHSGRPVGMGASVSVHSCTF